MKTEREGLRVYLCDVHDFSPELIFECGQAFRWTRKEDGSYLGIVRGTPLKVFEQDDRVVLQCAAEGDYDRVWHEYFDLGRDYTALRCGFSENEKLAPAVEFGRGIRILKQDFWEALCSFIISQCNNIPRIKGIISSLCSNFGDEIEFDGGRLYTFPSAERIAGLTAEQLGVIRAGYRAEYILCAARAYVSGELSGIQDMSTGQARKLLMSLHGVGRKVADCVLLYGLGRMEVYPVDVWMKRVALEYFGDKAFDGEAAFGGYAGLAQQYLFHYIRNTQG